MSLSMFLGRVVLPGAALVVAVAVAWQSVRTIAQREDAGPVRLQAVAVQEPVSRLTAEGRVVAYPGARVTVGAEVLGTIIKLPAREKAAVHRGDLLVELRSDDVQAALREARHRLTEMEVGLRLERVRNGVDRLLMKGSGKEPGQPDLRGESLTAAIARRDSAQAAIDRLEAELAKYRVVAPIEGVVIARHAELGETVNATSPLVTIADLRRLRVEAEIDEFDVESVTLGAEAVITAEGYPPRRFRGVVEEIADAVGPRELRPEDPARPGDTRALRVQVAFAEPCTLKLGQRVEVVITEEPKPKIASKPE